MLKKCHSFRGMGGKSTKKFGMRNVEIEKIDEVNVELFAIAGSNNHWKICDLYH